MQNILPQLDRIEALLRSSTGRQINGTLTSRDETPVHYVGPTHVPDTLPLLARLPSWPKVSDLLPDDKLTTSIATTALQPRRTSVARYTSRIDSITTAESMDLYFQIMHPQHALILPYSWSNIYKAARNSDFMFGVEACLVLLLSALGARTTVDVKGRPRKENLDRSRELFDRAMASFADVLLCTELVAAQCCFLAAEWLKGSAPNYAHQMLDLAITKTQPLVDTTDAHDQMTAEELLRLRINLKMCADDIAALTSTKPINHAVLTNLGVPRSVDLTTDTSERLSDEVSLLAYRHALHRIATSARNMRHLDTKVSVDVDSAYSLVLELDSELSLWHDRLHAPFDFSESDFSTVDPFVLSLRFAYFSCRAYIFRPFILAVLQEDSYVVDPNINAMCKKCLAASVRQIEHAALV